MTDVLEELQRRLGPAARRNEPLARYTSSRVGGPADLFYVAQSQSDLAGAVDAAADLGVPWRLIGSASNLLVADDGVEGLVVKANTTGTRLADAGGDGTALLDTEAGCIFASIARQVSRSGLGGLEWASNVPGTVGAAVVNNSGAFGSSTAEHLVQAIIHEPGVGARAFLPEELELSYRTSRLKRGELRGVVLQATFRVKPGEAAASRRRLREVQEQRRRTQPTGYSLGSVFANPPGDSAGRLIEAAGLKGRRVGGAEVSHLHANFVLNQGRLLEKSPKGGACSPDPEGLGQSDTSGQTARAFEILELVKIIQQRVWEHAHIWLVPEIQLIGRWLPAQLRGLSGHIDGTA